MKKIICWLFGHKMYKVKTFYNLAVSDVYNFAIEQDECVRCGDNSSKKLIRQLKWND